MGSTLSSFCYQNICAVIRDPYNPHRRFQISAYLLALLSVVVIVCVLSIYVPSSSQQKLPTKNALFPYVPLELSINHSVDPCEDFHSFVCGQWPKYAAKVIRGPYITPFTILQSSVDRYTKETFLNAAVNDHFPEIVNNAIVFYYTCLDTTNKEKLEKIDETFQLLLQEMGGWPLLDKTSWNELEFNWLRSCSAILRWLGIDTLFSTQVGVDNTDSSRNIMLIKAPQLNAVTFDDESAHIMLTCVIRMLNTTLSEEEMYSDIKEMAALERRLLGLLKQHNSSAEPQKMTVAALQKEIPSVNWLELIQMITNETLCPTNRCFTERDSILIGDITYLKDVIALFNSREVKKKALANLLGWFVIRELYVFLPGVLLKYYKFFKFSDDDYLKFVKGICYDKTSNIFSDSLSYLYIKSVMNFNAEDGVTLVTYLKNSFSSIIKYSKWLDDETKGGIIKKLEAMFEVNGYAEVFSDKQKLDENFIGFPSMTKSSVRNFLLSWRYFVSRNLLVLRSKNTLTDWVPPRPVTHAGAYYVVDRNAIVLPIAIQNPPFFYEGGPWYLNFGALGSMIGHEINHGYDNIGRSRDESGTLSNWWTKKSTDELKKRLTCFEKQFDKYLIDGITSVNGTKTLSENAADSMGLEQAYLAYKKWEEVNGKESSYPGMEHLSSDQMFFVGFASQYCAAITNQKKLSISAIDPHSPPDIRILGSVSNSKSFAKAFSCKMGSPMNPRRKCAVW